MDLEQMEKAMVVDASLSGTPKWLRFSSFPLHPEDRNERPTSTRRAQI